MSKKDIKVLMERELARMENDKLRHLRDTESNKEYARHLLKKDALRRTIKACDLE